MKLFRFLSTHWWVIAGIATLLLAVGVLVNPFTTLQAQITQTQAQLDQVKANQPTPDEQRRREQFEEKTMNRLDDLTRTVNAIDDDVHFIRGEMAEQEKIETLHPSK